MLEGFRGTELVCYKFFAVIFFPSLVLGIGSSALQNNSISLVVFFSCEDSNLEKTPVHKKQFLRSLVMARALYGLVVSAVAILSLSNPQARVAELTSSGSYKEPFGQAVSKISNVGIVGAPWHNV